MGHRWCAISAMYAVSGSRDDQPVLVRTGACRLEHEHPRKRLQEAVCAMDPAASPLPRHPVLGDRPGQTMSSGKAHLDQGADSAHSRRHATLIGTDVGELAR